jgi:hypothetical protein
VKKLGGKILEFDKGHLVPVTDNLRMAIWYLKLMT